MHSLNEQSFLEVELFKQASDLWPDLLWIFYSI